MNAFSGDLRLPDYIEPTIFMELPNEKIIIHEGEFIIELKSASIKFSGEIFFNWFPKIAYYFRGSNTDVNTPSLSYFFNSSIKIENEVFGEILPYSLKLKPDYQTKTATYSIYGQINISPHYYDYSPSVSKVNFSLTNYNFFKGMACKKIKDGDLIIDNKYYAFRNSKYRISISLLKDYDDHLNKLKSSGGYYVLGGGSIQKLSGSISYNETLDELLVFSLFISFINGYSISPVFLQGICDKKVIWEDHTPILENDSYKSSIPSWTPFEYNSSFNDMWDRFSYLCVTKNNKQFLELIVRWYLMLLRGSVENTIVISQIALELLYNWYVVEENKLILGKDCENIEASNKIRLLLGQIGIDYSVPENYAELREYIKSNKEVRDPVDALTSIRNILIHSQGDKRKNYAGIREEVKDQVIDLSIHFIELSLLKILNYNGNYYNRVIRGEEHTPW